MRIQVMSVKAIILVAVGVSAMLAGCTSLSQATPAAKADSLPPIRIVLAGDSTVADCPPEMPNRGWGQMFKDYLTGPVELINLAEGGQSTNSFRTSGKWQQVLDRKADFILIQFGHNDEPGHDDRTTDPNTTYRANLIRFVDEARARGAKPILVTPVSRMHMRPDGAVSNKLKVYADAMKAVASQKSVPLVDLNTASAELYAKLGPAGMTELGCGGADRTHFSPKGAKVIAGLVAKALPDACPGLKPYIKPPR